MKVSLRPSTPVSTAVAEISVPRPEGLICVVFISEPTVVEPSGKAAATARIAAFSISATMAGVANTSISPEPIATAVLAAVTVVVLQAESPFSNISILFFNIRFYENNYLCAEASRIETAFATGFSDADTAKVTIFPEMKKRSAILPVALLLVLLATHRQAAAQGGRGFLRQEWIVERGDSIPHIYLLPVYVFDRPVDLRRYQKLVRAVKRVYPMAQTARAKMAEMEGVLLELPTKKEQKAYIKQVYNQIKEEYTPVAKHMTRTEGRVLLKLIDRETDYTAYEVLREFRGGFVAGFWQGISRLFGQNLKAEYDKEGEDRIIEQIVIYYEAGLL